VSDIKEHIAATSLLDVVVRACIKRGDKHAIFQVHVRRVGLMASVRMGALFSDDLYVYSRARTFQFDGESRCPV
jgi:hypothetical protein